jgi:hypothetical protein
VQASVEGIQLGDDGTPCWQGIHRHELDVDSQIVQNSGHTHGPAFGDVLFGWEEWWIAFLFGWHLNKHLEQILQKRDRIQFGEVGQRMGNPTPKGVQFVRLDCQVEQLQCNATARELIWGLIGNWQSKVGIVAIH